MMEMEKWREIDWCAKRYVFDGYEHQLGFDSQRGLQIILRGASEY